MMSSVFISETVSKILGYFLEKLFINIGNQYGAKVGITPIRNVPSGFSSGINHGRNLGTDVLYSGTVGAALEGIIMGFPAAAVSHSGTDNYDFDFAADFVAKNIEKIRDMSRAKNAININFPKGGREAVKGVRFCALGREMYQDRYKIYNEENEEEGYILMSLPHHKVDNPEDSDIILNVNKYITITPLKLDMTDYDALVELKGFSL